MLAEWSALFWVLGFPPLCLVLLLGGWWLARRNWLPPLRDMPAYQLIHDAITQSTETGNPVHLSLGMGGIHDTNTLETVASLAALELMSEQPAVTTNRPIVTTANPTTLLLAQDMLGSALREREQHHQHDLLTVQFIGGQAGASGVTDVGGGLGGNANAAYAAGVMDVLEHQPLSANVMLGHFDDDYLLMGEANTRREITHVAGSANPNALPFMQATATHTLLGEEIFAAGAYLRGTTWERAGVLTQDIARWILIGWVVAAVWLKTIGVF
jgi:hypothetical protein